MVLSKWPKEWLFPSQAPTKILALLGLYFSLSYLIYLIRVLTGIQYEQADFIIPRSNHEMNTLHLGALPPLSTKSSAEEWLDRRLRRHGWGIPCTDPLYFKLCSHSWRSKTMRSQVKPHNVGVSITMTSDKKRKWWASLFEQAGFSSEHSRRQETRTPHRGNTMRAWCWESMRTSFCYLIGCQWSEESRMMILLRLLLLLLLLLGMLLLLPLLLLRLGPRSSSPTEPSPPTPTLSS